MYESLLEAYYNEPELQFARKHQWVPVDDILEQLGPQPRTIKKIRLKQELIGYDLSDEPTRKAIIVPGNFVWR
jgi:hypothetical protein